MTKHEQNYYYNTVAKRYISTMPDAGKSEVISLPAQGNKITDELAKALEDIELRTTQARLAASIGTKKDRTEFLLGELDRIASVAVIALAKAGLKE